LQIQPCAQTSYSICDDLPWLRVALSDSLLVQLPDEVYPGALDFGCVAVIGGLIDEKTEVEVAGLVTVVVEKLQMSFKRPPRRSQKLE